MILGWPTFKIICNTPIFCQIENQGSDYRLLGEQWTIEEISIFGNSSHLEWRAGLSDTFLKETHPRTIPARFSVIWFRGFRGEDLNVIFYQNMSNLQLYIAALV
jgi:hypothetical protein